MSFALSGGTITSFFDTVMPACVAYLKPRSLNASRTCEIAGAPNSWTSWSRNAVTSRFLSVVLMNE